MNPILFDLGNTTAKVLDTSTNEILRFSKDDFVGFLKENERRQFFGYASGSTSLRFDQSQSIRLLKEDDVWPLASKYSSMSTLGMDRWALCNAHFLEGHQNFLLVTMGTCITYNVVREGVFLGGAISPGWEMRYEAMNTMTAALPRIQYSETSALLGSDTEGSLQAGVDIALQKEMEGMIADYTSTFKLNEVLICGGHSERLPKPLKNYIFAPVNYELHAIRRLYDYYAENGTL
ncbi:MAG: type III pantothenate kinase [Schleiferiaceae bacterium]